jgi:hypothetical protein
MVSRFGADETSSSVLIVGGSSSSSSPGLAIIQAEDCDGPKHINKRYTSHLSLVVKVSFSLACKWYSGSLDPSIAMIVHRIFSQVER